MQLVLERVLPADVHSLTADDARQVARRLLAWGRRQWCALRGHELTFHFEPNRLSLHCEWCGVETPGWQLDIRKESQSRRGVGTPPDVIRPVRAFGAEASPEGRTDISGSRERSAA